MLLRRRFSRSGHLRRCRISFEGELWGCLLSYGPILLILFMILLWLGRFPGRHLCWLVAAVGWAEECCFQVVWAEGKHLFLLSKQWPKKLRILRLR